MATGETTTTLLSTATALSRDRTTVTQITGETRTMWEPLQEATVIITAITIVILTATTVTGGVTTPLTTTVRPTVTAPHTATVPLTRRATLTEDLLTEGDKYTLTFNCT